MKRLMVFGMIAALAFSAAARVKAECADPVATEQGPVTGYHEAKEPACGYKGIPYAAAPTGELRWKAPRQAGKRGETLKAEQFGSRCVSGGSGSGAPEKMLPKMDEDCLNLNVWRPDKSGTFPVMVWIHGGSLAVGTAAEPIYGGERLAGREDVVVVSINYRLNYYGFLALPELAQEDANGSAGNYGLMDQVAALKWVRANIANFGGDPQNVTIFGESAGGWSVCHLLASPLAAGLFNQAILESGGCDAAKTLDAGFADGRKFAENVGCAGDHQLACLRGLSPDKIKAALDRAGKKAEAAKRADKETKNYSLGAMAGFTWLPHVDGYALKGMPKAVLQSGQFNRVPLMVGSNRDEIKLFTLKMPGARLLSRGLVEKGYAKIFNDSILARTKELYPYGNYKRPIEPYLDAAGDMALGCACWEAAEAVAASGPVYYYRFDFNHHLAPDLVGAAHGFEIPFVFGNLDKYPGTVLLPGGGSKDAKALSAQMMSYWSNFAKTGNPNGPGLPDWPVYQAPSRQRMYFNSASSAQPEDNYDKCLFWRETGITITTGKKD